MLPSQPTAWTCRSRATAREVQELGDRPEAKHTPVDCGALSLQCDLFTLLKYPALCLVYFTEKYPALGRRCAFIIGPRFCECGPAPCAARGVARRVAPRPRLAGRPRPTHSPRGMAPRGALCALWQPWHGARGGNRDAAARTIAARVRVSLGSSLGDIVLGTVVQVRRHLHHPASLRLTFISRVVQRGLIGSKTRIPPIPHRAFAAPRLVVSFTHTHSHMLVGTCRTAQRSFSCRVVSFSLQLSRCLYAFLPPSPPSRQCR